MFAGYCSDELDISFNSLGDGDPPRVNDTTGIYFDELEFPYTFSAGVTYEPGKKCKICPFSP